MFCYSHYLLRHLDESHGSNQDQHSRLVPNWGIYPTPIHIKDRMEAAAKQNQLERLQYENMELKEALEEERSFSDRLLEDIDRVLDMLERHLPRQLLHLVDKARELLPEHQTYRQQQQRERGHSWDDMSL